MPSLLRKYCNFKLPIRREDFLYGSCYHHKPVIVEQEGGGWGLSHLCIQLFAALWTVARQAPLSMGFSSKKTGMGCCALLQGIFLAWGSNLRHVSCTGRWVLYHQCHLVTTI